MSIAGQLVEINVFMRIDFAEIQRFFSGVA
jgi:hypothetical protein